MAWGVIKLLRVNILISYLTVGNHFSIAASSGFGTRRLHLFISADTYTIIREYSAYVTAAGLLLVAWLKIESSFSQKEN